MADLHLALRATSLLSGWTIASTNASALAAVPDAIVQRLGITHDALTLWAQHYSEQSGLRHEAYAEERDELGIGARCEVVELARPHRPNVVWLDRFHLVATSASATTASRIAGLYTSAEHAGQHGGSATRLTMWLHDPSVTSMVAAHAAAQPAIEGAGWDDDAIAMSCRCCMLVDARRPGTLELRCPPIFAAGIGEALTQLSQLVAPW